MVTLSWVIYKHTSYVELVELALVAAVVVAVVVVATLSDGDPAAAAAAAAVVAESAWCTAAADDECSDGGLGFTKLSDELRCYKTINNNALMLLCTLRSSVQKPTF